MHVNDIAAHAPRTDRGFEDPSFAATVLDPEPRPPEAWDVRTPRDLVPLHRQLLTQAAALAGRGGAAAGRLKHWTEAARTVSTLQLTWAVRVHNTAAGTSMRDAAGEAVQAALAALRPGEPDPGGHLALAGEWVEQVRMSSSAKRRRGFRWTLVRR
ncbi:hypothetical protein [Amycolatopsis sp. NPDC004079]|uniref:hypothetical protein n=1 Tax=Amycolatopsis sp. NPDC004079 TaxID=3154549 RepID=UPI0033A59A89